MASSKFVQRLITGSCLAMGGLGWTMTPAIAQIASDGTLPVPTSVNQSGNTFTITNGTQSGGNLFHSFSQFSVPTGGTALFNTSQYSGIQNIFSRVTGGSVSTIDGTIQVSPTGANFFLLNPNGIIFGPNAKLDIGGSFLATTGSSIRFADGTEFSATAQTPPVLTVSVPIGVQFGTNPGNIQVNGPDLQTFGKTFGLLGGDITIQGGAYGFAGNDIVQATSGRLELGSVAGGSFVNLSLIDRGFVLGYSQVATFQNIKILQNSSLTAYDGGDIQVQGKQIQLSGGSQITTTSSSSLPAGTLTINASDLVEILGTGIYSPGEFSSGVFNRTSTMQPAGAISINTQQLIIRDGGRVSAETFGSGQGGNITINASNFVEVSGVSATDPVNYFSSIIASARENSTGNAGKLEINTNLLTIKNGGQISVNTLGDGQGGNLTVNAAAVQLIGGSSSQVNGLLAQAGSSLSSVNVPTAVGQGGSLTVNAGSLLVQDGSRISSATYDAGNAGSLVIKAGQVEVTGRSLTDQSPSIISASSVSSGAAGNLSIAADKVTVKNGGQIAVSGTGTGVAGNLQISSPFILLDNQGKLLAETKAGQGNISLTTSDLRLRHNSLISTNATGTATGGNITISTKTLVALENSDITANAQESFGGRVSIRATAIFGTAFRLFLTPNSDITATSALGPDFSGQVILQTPGIDPSQGLVQLESDVVDLSKLVQPVCSPNSQQAGGEFFRTGRGGLPISPADAVTDDRVFVDLGKPASDRQPQTLSASVPQFPPSTLNPPSQQISNAPPLLQAQGWIVNDAGQVVLVAQSTAPPLKTSGLLFPPCLK